MRSPLTSARSWFDAGVNASLTPRVGSLVAELAPDVACHSCAGFDQRGAGSGTGVGIRWMGNEQGVMPLPNWGATRANYSADGGDPLGAIFAPASCDTVLSDHFWFGEGARAGVLRASRTAIDARRPADQPRPRALALRPPQTRASLIMRATSGRRAI